MSEDRPFIPYGRQRIEDDDIAAVADVLKSDFLTTGPVVEAFEAKLADITGAEHAVSCSSGTSALHLAAMALDLRPGDHAVVSAMTFLATANAARCVGAEVTFADVDPDTGLMTPDTLTDALERAGPQAKAVFPVHINGQAVDMVELRAITTLPIVEDACHAINAKRGGKTAGAFGDTACFSMHPLKNLNVWGDGGIITTNNKDLHDELVLSRNHGLVSRDVCNVFAYNSRLDTIQAIVGNHYIKKIDHITDMRIRNANFFDKELSTVKEVIIPERHVDNKQVFHLYVIRVKERDKLQKFLTENGIDAKIHYPIPMHLQPASKDFGYSEGDFPLTEKICKEILSLPVHEFITEEQTQFTVAKIKEFYS